MGWIRGLPTAGGGSGDPAFSGTPGSIPFIGTDTFLTEDNANLFYDDTNNRVGIGTNAPDSRLHIVGVTGTSREQGLVYDGGALTALAGGELIDWDITLPDLQFGSGTTLALQRSMHIDGPTLSATSAKIITLAASLNVAAPVPGSNVSISTSLGDGFYAVRATGMGGFRCTISGVSGHKVYPSLDTCYGAPAASGVPAATEVNAWVMGTAAGDNIVWNGAPAVTQRWVFLESPQLGSSVVGPHTITNAATLAIEGAPSAGANISITNALAIWVQAGRSLFAGGVEITGGTVNPTTGYALNSDHIMTPNAIDFSFKVNDGSANRYYIFDSSARRTGIGYGVLDSDCVAGLSVIGPTGGSSVADVLSVKNFLTTGYSNVACYNSSGTLVSGFGYGNASAAAAARQNRAFTLLGTGINYTITDDTVHYFGVKQSTTTPQIMFGTATPTTYRFIDITQPVLTAVSSLNTVAITGAAHTNLVATTSWRGLAVNLNQTIQWATGTLAAGQVRAVQIFPPTIAFVGASTAVDPTTLYIDGAPILGTNATFTDSYALFVNDGRVRLDTAVALGGGAAPTFGTIGGSGPATAAQNEWIEITTQNGRRWVPAWA